jgi:hypothetical protein
MHGGLTPHSFSTKAKIYWHHDLLSTLGYLSIEPLVTSSTAQDQQYLGRHTRHTFKHTIKNKQDLGKSSIIVTLDSRSSRHNLHIKQIQYRDPQQIPNRALPWVCRQLPKNDLVGSTSLDSDTAFCPVLRSYSPLRSSTSLQVIIVGPVPNIAIHSSVPKSEAPFTSGLSLHIR